MSDLCLSTALSDGGAVLAGSLFLAGLAGGFTHCAGMCGPFVLARSTLNQADPGLLRKVKSIALIPYHLGRMTTYTALAVMFSTVLGIGFLTAPAKAALSSAMLLVAGCIFLVTAVPRLAVFFPWAARMRLPVPQSLIEKITVYPCLSSSSPVNTYILGLFLGFMPCGLVVAAILAASAAHDPAVAAAGMVAFSAGTIPALWLVAAGGHMLKEIAPSTTACFSVALTLFSGLSLLYLAGHSILQEGI